jgi:hypothetical protein
MFESLSLTQVLHLATNYEEAWETIVSRFPKHTGERFTAKEWKNFITVVEIHED